MSYADTDGSFEPVCVPEAENASAKFAIIYGDASWVSVDAAMGVLSPAEQRAVSAEVDSFATGVYAEEAALR